MRAYPDAHWDPAIRWTLVTGATNSGFPGCGIVTPSIKLRKGYCGAHQPIETNSRSRPITEAVPTNAHLFTCVSRTRWLPLAACMSTLFVLLLSPVRSSSPQQQANQNPSPTIDHTRPHPRIQQTEVPWRRFDLTSLKGARLFAGSRMNVHKPVPLIVHFHGAPWLVELHVARSQPKAALITVQLGSGSNAYRRPFEQAELFQSMLEEASRELGLEHGWSTVTLSGFSAGYGAVRQILRSPKYFALVKNVILLDGIHTSYVPEGKLMADGGTLDPSGLSVFIDFAAEAVAARKGFVLTHSEIFPGTYGSTTECADYLLEQLKLVRRPRLQRGPIGMQQLSFVDAGGFHLRGYAGNSAPDHVDHLQAMPAWFRLLHF